MRKLLSRALGLLLVGVRVASLATGASAAEPMSGSTLRTVSISSLPAVPSQSASSTTAAPALKLTNSSSSSGNTQKAPPLTSTLSFSAVGQQEGGSPPRHEPIRQASFLDEAPANRGENEVSMQPVGGVVQPFEIASNSAAALNPTSASPTGQNENKNAGRRSTFVVPTVGANRPPAHRGLASPIAQASPQAQQLLNRYAGESAVATLSQMPRRTPIRPAESGPVRQQGKPFQAISQDPTVSPYLNLHRAENDEEGAPNYFAFVQPQMDQIEAGRRQQAEILRLQRQMQNNVRSAGGAGRGVALPNSGVAARYRDTAQFYSGWQR
jgi:hypothetical protein